MDPEAFFFVAASAVEASAPMAGLDFLQDLAVVMVVAGLGGWICQRIGLSSVVGFLFAGILIGPHTPPFSFVSDLERIHTLSQLGLVFLMFSVGMGLSIRRLRAMGLGAPVAAAFGALVVFVITRWAGLLIGWTPSQSLFLAAMLMVSSSAIINKVLHEIGATHEPASRRALGISVLEDVVAVVMLTVLTSMSRVAGGEAQQAPIAQTLGLILVFVIVLVIAGLLLVPRFLGKLARTADPDLQTILIVGMILGGALLAVQAGYSIALGAFLLGAIVAETAQRSQVERYIQGLRDIFTAVFFVSIGMLMDVKMIGESWHLVLLFGFFTLVVRTFACTAGLLLIGNPTRQAVRSGLMLTPIGEFSFIIAQLGVASKAAPELIYPLAVGIAFFTAVTAPFLIRHSAQISRGIERLEPVFFRELVAFYHGSLEKLQQRQQANLVWQLSKKRLTQVAMGFLFVTGLLAFSQPIFFAVFAKLGSEAPLLPMWKIGFWLGLGLLTLAPLVAIWRNLAALSAIYAEALTREGGQEGVMRVAIRTGLQTTFAVATAIWLWLAMPFNFAAIWTVAAVVALLGLLLLLLRRKLIMLHSKVEFELEEVLSAAEESPRSYRDLLQPHSEWNIHVHEFVLPDDAQCAGSSLSDLGLRKLGCSVAGVDRHGFAIPNPTPDLILYPGDTLLLLATPEQMKAVEDLLGRIRPADEKTQLIEEIEMQGVIVPESSHAVGNLLVELEIPAATGVQIVGIERDGNRLLNPGPFQGVEPGDRLLALGTPQQIETFERWLEKGRIEENAQSPTLNFQL